MSRSQSTFWVYIKEMLDGLIPADGNHRDELNELLCGFAQNPLAEQHNQALRLYEIMAALPKGHALAFQFGSQIPLTAYAPLAVPMKFAPDVRESLRFLSKYMHLQAPLISVKMTETKDQAELSLNFRLPTSDQVDAFLAAGAFSALSTEISRVTGSSHNFRAITLRHCPEPYQPLYKRYFGVIPKLDASKNIVIIPASVLKCANPFADRATFARYREEYDALVKDSLVDRKLSEQIRQIIAEQIAAPPNCGELAAQLCLSERQLRFALSKESTNYREIIKKCRVDHCRTQLANPRMTISKLAEKLGYSDITAFNHGFKRWTGKSPSAFQRQILSE
ncbi:MAG: AraC-like DNA-binding protein [Zhongshania sp.]|jgi:AraC-like DNA-binding protein